MSLTLWQSFRKDVLRAVAMSRGCPRKNTESSIFWLADRSDFRRAIGQLPQPVVASREETPFKKRQKN